MPNKVNSKIKKKGCEFAKKQAQKAQLNFLADRTNNGKNKCVK